MDRIRKVYRLCILPRQFNNETRLSKLIGGIRAPQHPLPMRPLHTPQHWPMEAAALLIEAERMDFVIATEVAIDFLFHGSIIYFLGGPCRGCLPRSTHRYLRVHGWAGCADHTLGRTHGYLPRYEYNASRSAQCQARSCVV